MPSGRFNIFLYPKSLDMRAGYDRLAYLCKEELGINPYQGAIFIFFNRERNRTKIFFYDGSGCCVFSKRLEQGRFKVPMIKDGEAYGVVPSSDLALLLEGVDISQLQRPKHWPSPEVD